MAAMKKVSIRVTPGFLAEVKALHARLNAQAVGNPLVSRPLNEQDVWRYVLQLGHGEALRELGELEQDALGGEG